MTSPLELLDNKQDRIPSFFADKYHPMLGTILGVGASCYVNFFSRKPVLSGIQKHFAFGATGLLLAIFFDKKRSDYLAERDAVLRHYVQLHPEDFPTPKRLKYGEVIERWVPIR